MALRARWPLSCIVVGRAEDGDEARDPPGCRRHDALQQGETMIAANDMERPALSVVIATLGDESELGALLADLRPLADSWATTYEIIVAGAARSTALQRVANTAGAR